MAGSCPGDHVHVGRGRREIVTNPKIQVCTSICQPLATINDSPATLSHCGPDSWPCYPHASVCCMQSTHIPQLAISHPPHSTLNVPQEFCKCQVRCVLGGLLFCLSAVVSPLQYGWGRASNHTPLTCNAHYLTIL